MWISGLNSLSLGVHNKMKMIGLNKLVWAKKFLSFYYLGGGVVLITDLDNEHNALLCDNIYSLGT